MTNTLSRPWRNNNPGDLRTLSGGQKWYGQSGIDTSHGGPFAIFANRTDGWRALATNLIAYQDLHNLHTVKTIIGRFAPECENDTNVYVQSICNAIGCKPNDLITIHSFKAMLPFVKAIAVMEGGRDLVWPEDEIEAGIRAAGCTDENVASKITLGTHAALTNANSTDDLDKKYNPQIEFP